MSTDTTLRCIRCLQPLPESSAYCVNCGCNNEGLLDQRVIGINRDLEDRQLPWLIRVIKDLFKK